jgi:hypothetical protein
MAISALRILTSALLVSAVKIMFFFRMLEHSLASDKFKMMKYFDC